MASQLKKTHLHEFHKQEARMTAFAGFDMPVWYKGIIPEHLAVRNSVGIFDITHMGRAIVTGAKSEAFLNYVTTNDVAALAPMSAHYSNMCNEQGGIKDDFVLSRLEQEKFFLVYNAANRKKDYEWLVQNAGSYGAKVEDVSDNIAMFAVQGPKAQETMQKIARADLSKVERFKCSWTKLAGEEGFVSRTGYTGEDGFEVFVWNTPVSNPTKALKVWNAILEAGKEYGIEPCGLGARDTLRLEAGLCLYGNDIDEETTPLEAGLSFVVKLKKDSFIGKDALVKQKAEGIKRKRVGLVMLERSIPRQGNEVFKDNQKIGAVTSGTFSPILEKGVAVAYVSVENAVEGNIVEIKIRDKMAKAQIAKFPLYDTTKYGYMRQK
jgi:aminomethyltransferase